MLQVKTFLDKSNIHGIGLFLSDPVKKGDLIWHFTQGIDRIIPREEIEGLTKEEQEFIENAAVYDEDEDGYYLVSDNIRFMNHSDTPNCGETDQTSDALELFALRDIEPGEELTLDYNQMEEGSDDFGDEMFVKFNKK